MKLPRSKTILTTLGLLVGLLALGGVASARKVLGQDMAPTIAPAATTGRVCVCVWLCVCVVVCCVGLAVVCSW